MSVSANVHTDMCVMYYIYVGSQSIAENTETKYFRLLRDKYFSTGSLKITFHNGNISKRV